MWHSTMSYSYSTRQRFRFCHSVNEKWKWNSWYERIFRSFGFFFIRLRLDEKHSHDEKQWRTNIKFINIKNSCKIPSEGQTSDVIISSQLFSFEFQILICLTKRKILSCFIVFYFIRFEWESRHEQIKLIVDWSSVANINNLCFCLRF